MAKKELPIGIDSFAKVIKGNYYYVDKTLLIKEFLKQRAEATLILRPRRFGKTLNMSMFKCFFEKPIKGSVDFEESTTYLFDNLAISKDPDCMAHQGKYPVIFITLKDMKSSNWESTYNDIKKVIATEWSKRRYLSDSQKLFDNEHDIVKSLINGDASDTEYKHSLKTLTEFLHKHHGARPIVLIDEYDTPIYHGYVNGYYDQIIDFMRSWLGSGLKSNEHMEFGIVTGILKVAKESIFSGLNNLLVCDTTKNFYADKFGFSHKDVAQLIKDHDISIKMKDVESWYNGYRIGSFKAYNPWSILQLVKNNGELASYWVRTGVDNIIKPLLQKASATVKTQLATLMTCGTVEVEKNENIIFPELSSKPDIIWNFILGCGYMTWQEQWLEKKNNKSMMKIIIPNTEISTFFNQTVEAWIDSTVADISNYQEMLGDLVDGKIDRFIAMFKEYTEQSVSFFDPQGKYPERFYHGFALGLLVGLQPTHQIKSNREGGSGRYDVMIIPRDVSKLGLVLEFKRFEPLKDKDKSLKDTAKKALKQIKEKKYAAELRAAGVKKVVLVGMGFRGKEVEVVYEK